MKYLRLSAVLLACVVGVGLAHAGKYLYVPTPTDVWAVCDTTQRCAPAEDFIANADVWESVVDTTADGSSYLHQIAGTHDYQSQIASQVDTTCDYLWLRAKGFGTIWVSKTPFGSVPSNTSANILFNGAEVTDWTWTRIGNRSDENLQRLPAGSTVAINDVAQRDFDFTSGNKIYVLSQPTVQMDSWFCSTDSNATPVAPSGGGAGVTTNYALYEVAAEPTIDAAAWDQANVVPMTGYSTTPAAAMSIKAVWKTASPSRICVRGEETLASQLWTDVSTDDTTIANGEAFFAYFRMLNLDRTKDADTWLLGVSPQADYYDGNWPAGVFTTGASDLSNVVLSQSTSTNRHRMQACFDAPSTITTGIQWLCEFRQNERVTGGALEYQNAFGAASGTTDINQWGVCAAGVALPVSVDSTPPSVGAASVSNVSQTAFTVTATAADAESGISTCSIVYKTPASGTPTFGTDFSVTGTMAAGSCSATVSGLTAGTAYRVDVYAVNGAGLNATGATADQTTTSASGTTFYISTTGSGSTCSSGSPCALSRLTAAVKGDTWIIKNGTYLMTASNAVALNCSTSGNAHSGTAGQTITVQAETERQAWLKGDGEATIWKMTSCSYWKIYGLRFSGVDADVPTSYLPTMQLISSNHITVQRNLFHHLNRYGNNAFILNGGSSTQGGSFNTFIENEFYYFARYAILNKFGHDNISRRNYCNSRAYRDIVGYTSGYVTQGDACVQHYPDSNGIAENNIAEDSGASFSSESYPLDVRDNIFLGNISISSWFGAVQYGKPSGTMNINQTYRHQLMVSPEQIGWYMRNVRNLTCEQCTVVGGPAAYQHADQAAAAGSAPRSIHMKNVLAVGSTAYGFKIDETHLEDWDIDYGVSMAKAGGTDFSPTIASRPTNITHSFSTATNQLGSCRVWIPTGATLLKNAGLNGDDIGATVLYAYVNGVLTGTKLWNSGTGAWLGAGATIAGSNPSFSATVPVTLATVGINTVTNSAADVGDRLNITAAGCLPGGY